MTARASRLVNPRLGTFFSIFVSLLACIVLSAAILEQLGTEPAMLRLGLAVGPALLFLAIAVATACREPAEFLAAGRRVPPFFNGLLMAVTMIGATGLLAISGSLFLVGFDALCLVMGLVAGLVILAVLIAPFFRKFGAYTVPSYLGRRCGSRLVRIVAAVLLAVPLLLLVVAEIRMGAFAAAWLLQMPESAMVVAIAGAALAMALPGGMRSQSWSGAATAIGAGLALLVPVTIVAVLVTNLPLPQVSHGAVMRQLHRLELAHGLPIPQTAGLAFDLPGAASEPLVKRFAAAYGYVGRAGFLLAALAIMLGVASLPTLLARATTTPGVYEARKSLGWAVLIAGVALMTLSGVAVFMRDIVMGQLAGTPLDKLPAWFRQLAELGLARYDGPAPRVAVQGLSFHRDGVLLALPLAHGFPAVLAYLASAGIAAAALAAAGSHLFALAAMVSEDVVNGARWDDVTDRARVLAVRIALAAVAGFATWIALVAPADPLDLFLWALAVSGSTAFPVLVLSIWWKRLTRWGALVAMASGFAISVMLIVAGEAAWLGVPSALAGVLTVPIGFVVAIAVSLLTPGPSRYVLEMVRDLRVPGGEAVHDRQVRLAKLRQRQSEPQAVR